MTRLAFLGISAGLALSAIAGQLRAGELVEFIQTAHEPTASIMACDACPACGLDQCCCGPQWRVGFDFLFARPHWEHNPAYTTAESDGASFFAITETEFDYDFELTPRIWAHYESAQGVGLRAIYWEFDQRANAEFVQPPANGFGFISHPPFGRIDSLLFPGVVIASAIPTDTFATVSGLDVFTIDVEVTKRGSFYHWDLLAGAGVRFARIEQQYQAALADAAGTLVGAIDYSHDNEGFGPTFSLETRRAISSSLTAFAQSRASLLVGDASSRLFAGEDLDLITPIFTTQTSERDDVLPILELSIGGEWRSGEMGFGELFVRSAFETQWWGGVGSASSEDGDLGFVGLAVGVGLQR